MPHLDFLISNDRHHLAMTLPVARRLLEREGWSCRVLSLCELRGLDTPVQKIEAAGVPVERIVTSGLRRSPASGAGGGRPSLLRRAARGAAWGFVLRPAIERLLGAPDLVVLPNDAAYPYGRLADRLRARGTPFLLLQEGIRFPLPAVEDGRPYGGGGAAAVAAWGEASAEYFRSVGVASQRIRTTGSPRFDGLDAVDWRPEAATLVRRLGLEGGALLLVTNPIDDQGFCSRAQKLTLVGRLLAGLAPFLAETGRAAIVKLHSREAVADYERAARAAGVGDRTRIVAEAPLPALFLLSDAVVILASTVGLEALRAGKRLAVLEIPGHGFVHDYVACGAAAGLGWDEPIAGQVRRWLEAGDDAPARAAYVERHLAVREGAAERVAELAVELAEGRRGR